MSNAPALKLVASVTSENLDNLQQRLVIATENLSVLSLEELTLDTVELMTAKLSAIQFTLAGIASALTG